MPRGYTRRQKKEVPAEPAPVTSDNLKIEIPRDFASDFLNLLDGASANQRQQALIGDIQRQMIRALLEAE